MSGKLSTYMGPFWHQFKCKLTSCALSFYWSKMNLNQSKKCRFWKSKTPLGVVVVRVPSQKDNWMIQWGFLRVNFIPKTTVLSSKFIIWDIKYTCASLSKGTIIHYVSKRSELVGLENDHSCKYYMNIFAIVQRTVSDLSKDSNPLRLEWKSSGSSSSLKYWQCQGSNHCPLAWELGMLPLDQLRLS